VLEFGLDGQASGRERVLSEMAGAGYVGTELGDWGFLPTDPAELKGVLARHRLGMVGAFVPVALRDPAAHEAGAEAAVKVARLLAAVAEAPFVVLADDNGKVPERTANAGRIVPAQGLSGAEWTVFATGARSSRSPSGPTPWPAGRGGGTRARPPTWSGACGWGSRTRPGSRPGSRR
jgi:inosose dehydratase